jgi:hypothetical protein
LATWIEGSTAHLLQHTGPFEGFKDDRVSYRVRATFLTPVTDHLLMKVLPSALTHELMCCTD